MYKVQIWYRRWLPEFSIWGKVIKDEYNTMFPDPSEFINAPETKNVLFFNFIQINNG